LKRLFNRAACPITIKKALQKVPGVNEVKVDFERKTATVHLDANKANVALLTKATTDAGFPSTVRK
jgi:mercuric ion binding protein